MGNFREKIGRYLDQLSELSLPGQVQLLREYQSRLRADLLARWSGEPVGGPQPADPWSEHGPEEP